MASTLSNVQQVMATLYGSQRSLLNNSKSSIGKRPNALRMAASDVGSETGTILVGGSATLPIFHGAANEALLARSVPGTMRAYHQCYSRNLCLGLYRRRL
jgi:hypothetical protein